MKNESRKNVKPGFGFRLFCAYVRFFLQKIYFRKVYSVHPENVRQDIPLMVISNHQNGMCDPLCLLLSMPGRRKRKMRVITRASVFNNPFANKCLRWLGLLPAYRLAVDGEETLSNNTDTFNTVENELLNDGTVIIFPEGKHQDKHWLGEFSTGYLRMLFDAAEKSNFEKELFILPTCNHYSDYFEIRGEMLIQYGKPISLKPYYELYKTKPRTAQRQVNEVARKQVAEMMLNITDLENYTAINYIRRTYGIKFAGENNFNPDRLPEKLSSDKLLFARLENIQETNADELQTIYADVIRLNEKSKELHINDWNFNIKYSTFSVFLQGLLFVVLFPVFILNYIPNILTINVPRKVNTKVKDPMMHCTVRLLMSALVTVPVSAFLILTIAWILTKSLFIALLCVIYFPLSTLFVIYYKKYWRKWKSIRHFRRLQRQGKTDKVSELRGRIYTALDNLLK